jgi:xylan 1,4-beta-xylosidase
MHFRFILTLVLGLFMFGCQANEKAATSAGAETQPATEAGLTFTNPVLPGDYADPSVVRTGSDYWATATSSEWAPLFPILHSTNLVDWEIAGHVFPDKLPDWAEAHFWAPEIAFEKGKYYIYYTAKKKGGSLCVGVASATSATGPYTDHGALICQDAGAIDGFEMRDENGELYLIWKEDGNSRGLPTPLWGQRMNEERTALTGEMFELFRNDPNTWEGGLVEGPALVRRGEFFYTFYAGDACCGRECTYGVGVARSRSLKGPWEKHPANPIMQKNEAWKCPGHGTVVSDTEGRDYFLYHAYSTNSSVYAGRQGLLDEIIWDNNGWPSFQGKSPSITASLPGKQAEATATLAVQDNFEASALAQNWQWPVDQKPAYTMSEAGGQLKLQASPQKIGTVLGQRTKTADYTATTVLHKNTVKGGTMAGLTAIGDQENAAGIALANNEIIVWTVKGNTMNTVAKAAAPGENEIHLRLVARQGSQMEFAWSTNGTNWNTLNSGQPVDASYLPPWDRAIRVGLTAKGPASQRVVFESFEMKPNGK